MPEAALEIIDHAVSSAHPRETGGILVGYYEANLRTAVISEAGRPPKDSRAGRSWFIRGYRRLSEWLHNLWEQSPRRYYLGEWHYHPSVVVEPSDEDFAQMVDISRNRRYRCPEPVLLIVGEQAASARPCRVFVFPRHGQRVELLEEVLGDDRAVARLGLTRAPRERSK